MPSLLPLYQLSVFCGMYDVWQGMELAWFNFLGVWSETTNEPASALVALMILYISAEYV